ncbi:hypothetical protein BASA81_001244 [Batrachochytrium salamandrivorans]|nr:hypothetical protein BASA81_001244 [Batrachochytrium salamandrivorans]
MKSANQFADALQSYERELKQRLAELDQVVVRSKTSSCGYSSDFIWLDELQTSKDCIGGLLDSRAAGASFQSVLDFAEACADNLDKALNRAEHVALARFGITPAMPISPSLVAKPLPSTGTTTIKPPSTPHYRNAEFTSFLPYNIDDPPTPQMELSSATMSLLNKRI